MKTISVFAALLYSILAFFGLPYGKSDVIFTPGCLFTVETETDVFFPGDNVWSNGSSYPTVIQLEHNGNNNGTLLATFEVFDKDGTKFRIMESTDSGSSWTQISTVTETITEGLQAAWEPCLYELPEAMGNFPEGTVILGGISLDDGCRSRTQLSVWTSTDCGISWQETSVADEAGGLDYGIWEPCFIYDDGTLYCFYSDDSDPVYSQTIVYRSTTDLISWSEKVPVVVYGNTDARPGMPVVTKMGNGQFYLAYEVLINGENMPCRYKISDSVSEWDAGDEGTEISALNGRELHSSPVCLWLPAGGKNGTLIVGAKYENDGSNELLISRDYGKTYTLMINPLPYDSSKTGFGYSASMIYSEKDNAIYYLNAVDYKDSLSKIRMAKLSIKDFHGC